MTTSPALAPNAIETRTIRKARMRIIPFVSALFVIAALDRNNIGFAALTMNKELAISSQQYGFIAGIFFFGYSFFEIPSNLLLHKTGARVWIARILVTWGIVAMLTALAHAAFHLYVVRFLLGVAEAGYYPGIVLYLTYWFPQRHVAYVIALFQMSNPVANILGAPVSGMILDHIHWLGVSSWRWLMILEGMPAILGGVLTYFLLPARPVEAKFLTPEEKDWITGELAREEKQKLASGRITVGQALVDRRVWHLAAILFPQAAGFYSMIFWMPQFLKAFSSQYSNTTVGFLVMIPYLVGLPVMILVGRHSDRRLERRYHAAIPLIVGAISLVVLGTITTINSSVVLCVTLWCFVASGIFGFIGPFWSLPNEFLTGFSAAAGIALINCVGNLGGFVGPYVIGAISKKTGAAHAGLVFVGISWSVSVMLILALRKRTVQQAVSEAAMEQPSPAVVPTADMD